jgi:hypothetical protein
MSLYNNVLRSNGFLNAVLSLGLFTSSMFIAQQSLAQRNQPSVDQRQLMTDRHKKMAEMHSKMASCLASDVPLEQCRQQIRDTFGGIMGGHWQSMGDGPMHWRRNGTGGMMGGPQCLDWLDDTEWENTPKIPKSDPKN